jgi:hypothetical protein
MDALKLGDVEYRGQRVQNNLSTEAYFAKVQSTQEVVAGDTVDLPVMQFMHVPVPGAGLYCPLGHAVHVFPLGHIVFVKSYPSTIWS